MAAVNTAVFVVFSHILGGVNIILLRQQNIAIFMQVFFRPAVSKSSLIHKVLPAVFPCRTKKSLAKFFTTFHCRSNIIECLRSSVSRLMG